MITVWLCYRWCMCFVLDKHENAPVFQRLTLIDNEFPGAAVLLHKFGVMIKVLYVDFYKSFYLHYYTCDIPMQ